MFEPNRGRRTKKFAQHKSQAKKEREYYNQNIELVKKDREIVEKNYLSSHGKTKYCSVEAVAGCDFDWAQKILIPHFTRQPSGIFFDNPRKVEIFGFQNKATGEQLNYTLDESETIGKGSNGTLSLVFDGIKRFNKGEKYLKLTCDNAVGQNKNNATIQFLFYLIIVGYYKNIELDFMIPGHTKSRVDGNFGTIKKKYRKSTIFSKKQFDEIVEKSSPAGLNKVQCYEKKKGFQYFDFKGKLKSYFTKLPNISKYHHFLFEKSNLGVVKVKEFADGSPIKINLLKTEDKEVAKIIEEVRNLKFPILKPKLLSRQRLMDFYKIRPLIPKEYWDDFCPELKHENYVEPRYFSTRRVYLSPGSKEEIKTNSDEKFIAVDFGTVGCSFIFAKVT